MTLAVRVGKHAKGTSRISRITMHKLRSQPCQAGFRTTPGIASLTFASSVLAGRSMHGEVSRGSANEASCAFTCVKLQLTCKIVIACHVLMSSCKEELYLSCAANSTSGQTMHTSTALVQQDPAGMKYTSMT